MPILRIFGPVPATALIPLVMTLASDSFVSGAALIGFAVWFPVTMLTSSGIANVRISYLDVARTLGAGRLYLIFRVALPSALPNIFLGLFMGLGASFLTLIVAETVGVQAGLGWYLTWQQGYVEFDKVYAVDPDYDRIFLHADDVAVPGARPRSEMAKGGDQMVSAPTSTRPKGRR